MYLDDFNMSIIITQSNPDIAPPCVTAICGGR